MKSCGKNSELTSLLNRSKSPPRVTNSLTELLVGTVFVGEYAERHYVDSLATYRDVVVVDPEETALRQTLLKAMKLVRNTLKSNIWFGVTDDEHDRTPKGCCLWVNLSQVPLGKHWFRVESVDSRTGEILLNIKHLRSFNTRSQTIVKKSTSAELMDDFNLRKFLQGLDWPQVLHYSLYSVLNASTWCILNLKNILTLENIHKTITFSSLLILTIGIFLVEAAKFLANYSIKLINEFSFLIRSSTPIILGIFDFFAKCVGGFYLLLVMLWRGSSQHPTPSDASFVQYNNAKAIQYTPRAKHLQNEYQYPQRVPQPRGFAKDSKD